MAITLQQLRDDLRFRLMEYVPGELTNLMLNGWLNLGQFDVALRLQGINDTWLGERMPIVSRYSSARHHSSTINRYTATTKTILCGLSQVTANSLVGNKVILIDVNSNDSVYSGLVESNTDFDFLSGTLIILTEDPVGSNISSNLAVIVIDKDSQVALTPSIIRFKLPYNCMQLVKVTDNLDISAANAINPVLSQELEDISELEGYNSDVRYTQYGHRVILSKGNSVSYPGELVVWYHKRPVPLAADTDQLSVAEGRVPEEFQDLVIMHAFVKGIRGKVDEQYEGQTAVTGVTSMLDNKYNEIRTAFALERALTSRSENTKEEIR